MTSLSLLLHYSIFRLKKQGKKGFSIHRFLIFFIVLRLNLNDGKNDLDVIPSQHARQKYSQGATFLLEILFAYDESSFSSPENKLLEKGDIHD